MQYYTCDNWRHIHILESDPHITVGKQEWSRTFNRWGFLGTRSRHAISKGHRKQPLHESRWGLYICLLQRPIPNLFDRSYIPSAYSQCILRCRENHGLSSPTIYNQHHFGLVSLDTLRWYLNDPSSELLMHSIAIDLPIFKYLPT